MKYTLSSSAVIAATLLTTTLISSAEIAIYYEVNGRHLPTLDGTGKFSGGALAGQKTTVLTSSNYMGVEDGYFGTITPAGVTEYYGYVAGGADSPFCCSGPGTTLTLGPLAGQGIKNANYLGTMNGLNVYADSTGISSYTVLGNLIYVDNLWTTLTGGSLNGVKPARGVGLLDFAGNTELNDLYLVNVESDGTLGYYNTITGAYEPALDATYGSWSAFTDGPLAGLTLNQLKANPIGTANGVPYRFLGTYNDGIVFEVPATTTVPEPTANVLALGAAFVLTRRRRA
jgi:hypothetical protein